MPVRLGLRVGRTVGHDETPPSLQGQSRIGKAEGVKSRRESDVKLSSFSLGGLVVFDFLTRRGWLPRLAS